MEEKSELIESSNSLTNDFSEADRQELIKMIKLLTEAVNRLTERLDNLEISEGLPRQSRNILCPTIQINIPIGCYQRNLE